MTPDRVCRFRACLVEGCSSLSLTEYLRQILFDRSLDGWRSLRPRRKETIAFVLWTLVLLLRSCRFGFDGARNSMPRRSGRE
jgi:hypothetical protein